VLFVCRGGKSSCLYNLLIGKDAINGVQLHEKEKVRIPVNRMKKVSRASRNRKQNIKIGRASNKR